MAERRMFSKTIIDSDMFLDMPLSTQALYFHLSMRADDEGFINNPKKIQRMIGASDDDMKVLIAKQFIIPFDSGIVVIKHWRIHNYIRNDRFKPTICEEEKSHITERNGIYDLSKMPSIKQTGSQVVYQTDTTGIPSDNQVVYQMDTQDRLGKDSLRQDNIGKYIEDVQQAEQSTTKSQKSKNKKFVKPTVEEIRDYCIERKNNVSAQYFYDYYEANGWKVGKNPMKDWKATVRNWERRDFYSNNSASSSPIPTERDMSEWGF
mgnify:CR=1 FL=1|jgi:hypothetical protein